MEINKDLNDRIEQPSTKDNIKEMNSKLKDMYNKLYSNQLPMWLTNLIILAFKGGDFVDKTILAFLKTVMDNTEIDEQVYKIASDQIKETIPGEEFEPLIGEILEGIGKELQKK